MNYLTVSTTAYPTTPAATPAWTTPVLTTSSPTNSTASYQSSNPLMQRYYDNYKVFLKEKTNTTYDEYVGREILKRDDSASAYIRGRPSDSNNRPIGDEIKEHSDLISYFIDLFKHNSQV